MSKYDPITYALIDDLGSPTDNIRVRVYDSYTRNVRDGNSMLVDEFRFDEIADAETWLGEQSIQFENWC